MGVAAEAKYFEIDAPRIERVAESDEGCAGERLMATQAVVQRASAAFQRQREVTRYRGSAGVFVDML